ncbi:MAG: Trk system potassium transporter TrkA [Muribaculaceae bacterium]|nr:Trk system potassium transporter TrkA [Muribaculaceae bacterium]
MIVTIIGAGTLGSHLAKYLSEEQMDIYIVDRDVTKLSMLDSEHNLMTVVGDAIDIEVLRRAKAELCDLFIAVTDVAERNLVACGLAKSIGAKLTVARVDREDYLDKSNREVVGRMGVDNVFFPECLVSQGIVESLRHSWASGWYEFNNGAMVLLGVRLEPGAPLAGKYLRELSPENRICHVAAIRRSQATLIPNGNSRLLPNDILYIATTPANVDDVARLTGKTRRDISRVLIAGGGNTAELTISDAANEFEFTVIDDDIKRCQRLIGKTHLCDVIHGDPTEIDVLAEAGIEKADAFVALSGTASENVLACLLAADLGVGKTIAEVDRKQLVNLAESFNIDTVLNRQMLMANAMFQLLIDAGAVSARCLALPDAEVVRLEIKSNSHLNGAVVKDLRLPEELTFAGLIRDGKSMLVTGQTTFQEGDTVLVMCFAGALHKARKLFR